MRYTTSDNHTYRMGIGPVARPWLTTDQSPEQTILDYLERHVRVHDADTAGDHTVDFVFEDGTAWRLSYDWSVNDTGWYTDEFGEQPWIVDNYTIEPIPPEQARIVGGRRERDWL